jgi:hypothetical protein
MFVPQDQSSVLSRQFYSSAQCQSQGDAEQRSTSLITDN